MAHDRGARAFGIAGRMVVLPSEDGLKNFKLQTSNFKFASALQ
jgi:hypothetical protein